jgi:hypothetical protein
MNSIDWYPLLSGSVPTALNYFRISVADSEPFLNYNILFFLSDTKAYTNLTQTRKKSK